MKYQKLLKKYLKHAGSFVNAFEHPEDHKNLLLDFARFLDQEDYAASHSAQRTWAYGCKNCRELYDSEEMFKNHACAERPHR